MPEVTEIVQSTIDKVLERVDLIASKLVIAAKEVWKFSVTAKLVEARCDLWKSALLALVMLPFWGWSVHVAFSPIPHESEKSKYIEYVSAGTTPMPCDRVGLVNGKQVIMHGYCWNNIPKEVSKTEDRGISNFGWGIIASGLFGFIVGLVIVIVSVEGVINAIADSKTAEYDAYKDLIYDWKE